MVDKEELKVEMDLEKNWVTNATASFVFLFALIMLNIINLNKIFTLVFNQHRLLAT